MLQATCYTCTLKGSLQPLTAVGVLQHSVPAAFLSHLLCTPSSQHIPQLWGWAASLRALLS